jgi:hypothetical protein
MVRDMSKQDVYKAIVSDFEWTWNAMAADRVAVGRGNFMFARQAVTLLEWAARLASGGEQRGALRRFSAAMYELEPKYFTRLPGPCADNRDLELPSVGPDGPNQLLWALFDLMRHGGAHQYQQMSARLVNRRSLAISIHGAPFGETLGRVRRHDLHLACPYDRQGNVWVNIYPDTLFLDVRDAIVASRLLTSRLTFHYLTRPIASGFRRDLRTTRSGYWMFDTQQLKQALTAGGHPVFRDPKS